MNKGAEKRVGKIRVLKMKEQERRGEKEGRKDITVSFLYAYILHICCSFCKPQIPKSVSNSHYDNL
jgi:hypothetical protein